MPTGVTVDTAWIDILPSPRNFLPLLRSMTGAAAATAGTEAGTLFADRMAASVGAASVKLKAAQAAAANALGGVTTAQARLNDVQASGTASTARLTAAQEALEKAERNVAVQNEKVAAAQDLLNRAQARSAGAAEAAGSAAAITGGKFAGVSEKAGLLSGALGQVNRAYGLMFAAMTLALPVLPFAAAVKDAGNFQASLVRLVTTAGESRSNLQLVGDGLLKMAGQVGVGANELAKGMYLVESAGFHGADGLTVMRAAAEGARQENADLGKVVDAVTTILHDYNLPASEAANVTSQLVAAVSHGKISFEDLTGAMHSVTPLAAALHIPLADIAEALAAMTASGSSAEQATENMRNALLSLQQPNSVQISELAQLGISTDQLSASLGTRGLTGTMQDISLAIIQHMGPSGQVLLDALNQNINAGRDMQQMLGTMPPALQKLSRGLLDGSVSIKEYRNDVRDMGGQAGAMGIQFLGLYQQGDGFNQILKSGRPVVQTYEQALQRATGTTAGMSVALQLTGTHADAVSAAVKDVAGATAQADGNIRGWDEVQGTFNQKLAQAGAALGAMGIKIGTGLLPPLGTFLSTIADHVVPTMESWLQSIGKFVGSNGFQSFLQGIGTTAANIIGPIRQLIAEFVGSGGLHDLLLGVGAVAKVVVGALEAVGNIVGATLGVLVNAFGKLPPAVQAVIVAFAALRIAAAAGLFQGLISAVGTFVTALGLAGLKVAAFAGSVKAAFAETAAAAAFTSEIQGASAAASTAVGAISGFGSAAGVAAKGGLSAMKSGLSGIMGILGGPWGVALLAAGGIIALIIAKVQRHNEAVEKATTDVTAWYKAMATGGQPAIDAQDKLRTKQDELAKAQEQLDALQRGHTQDTGRAAGATTDYADKTQALKDRISDLSTELAKGKAAYDRYLESLSPVERATAAVNKAELDLETALKDHGPASDQAKDAARRYQAALSDEKNIQDQLNESEKTQIQRLDELAQKQLDSVSSALAAQQAELDLKGAIDQANQGIADGTIKGDDLTRTSISLGQQLIAAAQAAGQQAEDQAKANGVTDTAAVKNQAMLDTLQKYADQITGPGHDAVEKAITDLEAFKTAANQTSDDVKTGITKSVTDFVDGVLGRLSQAAQGALPPVNNLGSGMAQMRLEAYTTTGTFNTQLIPAMQGTQTQAGITQAAFANLANIGINGTVIPALSGLTGNINGPFAAALASMAGTATTDTGIFGQVFSHARDLAMTAMGDVQGNIAGPFTTALNALSTNSATSTTAVNASFTTMRDTATARLTDVQNNILGPTTGALDAFATTTNAQNSIVNASFTAMRDTATARLADVQNNILGPTTGALNALNTNTSTTLTSVKGAFLGMATSVVLTSSIAATGVNTAFNRIRAGVAQPVNFVSQNAIAGGLLPAFNNVAAAVGIGQIHPALPAVAITAPGPGILSAAAGGKIPGPYIGPTADNVLGYVPFGNGGAAPIRVNPREWIHPVSSVDYYGDDVMSAMQTRSISRDSLQLAMALTPGMSTGGRVPGFAGGGQTYPALEAWVRSNLPGSVITSAYRPGANDLHGAGDAVDISYPGNPQSLNMPAAAKIAASFGGISELIHNPNESIKNGRNVPPSFWGPATWAEHANHVHWAMTPSAWGGGGTPLGATPVGINVGGTLLTDPSQILAYLRASVSGSLATLQSTYGNNIVTQDGAGTVNKLVGDIWSHIQGSVANAISATSTSGGSVPATGSIKQIVQAQAGPFGWGTGNEWAALDKTIQAESGWNPTAQNKISTASGLGQFINSTWAAYRGSSGAATMKAASVGDQGSAIMRYIKARYGDPVAEWAFHLAHGYYSGGGQVGKAARFDQGGMWPDKWAGINTTGGRERVITPPQDNYFQRFVRVTEQITSGQDAGQRPSWHFYLGDREITELVDARMEYRDNGLGRDLRSSM